MRDVIRRDYFEWLLESMCGDRFQGSNSFRKLLTFLHDMEFRYSISRDGNRAKDGIELRRRFASIQDEDSYYLILDALAGSCSVLEMMVALAIKCEESTMDDDCYGDRTSQWFFEMVVSLGLGGMTDRLFDEQKAYDIIVKFLNREYEPDGRGGLFTVRGCDRDLRDVEIWHQMCWYLNTII